MNNICHFPWAVLYIFGIIRSSTKNVLNILSYSKLLVKRRHQCLFSHTEALNQQLITCVNRRVTHLTSPIFHMCQVLRVSCSDISAALIKIFSVGVISISSIYLRLLEIFCLIIWISLIIFQRYSVLYGP